jgi:hypothetical protein
MLITPARILFVLFLLAMAPAVFFALVSFAMWFNDTVYSALRRSRRSYPAGTP